MLAETGRNEDNPTELLVSDGKLEQDQAGLHGLAQADGISDQQARCGVTQDREQRLNLVGRSFADAPAAAIAPPYGTSVVPARLRS